MFLILLVPYGNFCCADNDDIEYGSAVVNWGHHLCFTFWSKAILGTTQGHALGPTTVRWTFLVLLYPDALDLWIALFLGACMATHHFILFILLFSSYVGLHACCVRRKIMVDRILRCEYTRMREGVWDSISPEAIQFVTSLLQCDPAARPSAPEALQSPWMLKHFASEDETANVTPRPSSVTVDPSESDYNEANEGDEEHELADETNTIIPGGKTNPSQTPKYKYDTHTKSVRPCC